jgi:DNA-binding MarR family transcriptional regulator
MSEDKEWKESDVTIATLRSTAKRESCMKILTYLNNNSGSFTISEISDALDLDWGTTKWNCLKLTEAGFIEPEEDKMDGRTKYFKISDKKAVEKAIEYYEDRQRKLKKQEEEERTKPKVEPVKSEVEEVE